jgi:PilZ domain
MQAARKSFHARAHHRVPVQCSLYFSNGTVYGVGTVQNLSMGGLKINSETSFAPGTPLTVYTALPNSELPIVIDEAVVCWRRERECGLAIRKLKSRDTGVLEHFIARHSPPVQ